MFACSFVMGVTPSSSPSTSRADFSSAEISLGLGVGRGEGGHGLGWVSASWLPHPHPTHTHILPEARPPAVPDKGSRVMKGGGRSPAEKSDILRVGLWSGGVNSGMCEACDEDLKPQNQVYSVRGLQCDVEVIKGSVRLFIL